MNTNLQTPIFRQLFDQESSTYTYLIADPETKEAVIIDPVYEKYERDESLIKNLGLKLLYILETHVHADHVTSASKLKTRFNAKIAISKNSGNQCADIGLVDNQILQFGRFEIKALPTPGHTNGCMSFLFQNMVFTGDSLMIGLAGRTDFQEGSSEKLYESVQSQLFTLSEDTLVYPGHDYQGFTVSTIGEEKKFNKRLGGGKTEQEFSSIMSSLNLPKPKKIDIAVPANMVCGVKKT